MKMDFATSANTTSTEKERNWKMTIKELKKNAVLLRRSIELELQKIKIELELKQIEKELAE